MEHLILYHTEDDNLPRRKELYTATGKHFFLGNLFVPHDLEKFQLQHIRSSDPTQRDRRPIGSACPHFAHLFLFAAFSAAGAAASAAAFPISFVSPQNPNSQSNNAHNHQDNKDIRRIHTIPPALYSDNNADRPHHKCGDPCHSALPENNTYRPFCPQFPLDGGDGSNTGRI